MHIKYDTNLPDPSDLTLKRPLSGTGPEESRCLSHSSLPSGAETAFRRLRPAVLRQHSTTLSTCLPIRGTLRRRENVRLGHEVVRKPTG